MRPKVSIVIPCYNMGEFIKDTIDSVFVYPNQEQIELIIVNDGSDDGFTKEIIDTFKGDNLTVIHQENMGLGKARNNGIALTKGDYILPLDADNLITNNFIDMSIAAFEQDETVSIVYGDAMYFGEKQGKWKVGSFDFPKLLSANYIDACACYRKNVWEDLKGYDECMPYMGSEDWDFWLRAYLKGYKFKYIDIVLFHYRVRPNSMVSGAIEKGFEISEYMFSKSELKDFKEVRHRINSLKKSDLKEVSLSTLLKELFRRLKKTIY